MIKELIVVEGKDDISAVKRAVEADVISTNGYGITKEILNVIEYAANTRGVIIFTDPDFAGDKIRRRIQRLIPQCKHAYLPRYQGTKKGNIGIENGNPQDILEALSKVQTIIEDNHTFTMEDLILLKLTQHPGSGGMRRYVGENIGIGYCNGKQFLKRLNNFGITREQLLQAIIEYKNEDVYNG